MPAEFNSVNEEIKNEAKKVLESKKGMEKVKYFVYYYKWWVIGIGVVALIVGSLVYDFVTRKDTAFQVMVVNGEYSEYCDYNAIMDPFAETIEYDPKKEEVVIDSSIHVDVHATDQTSQISIQKIFLNITSQDLDVLICDKDILDLACKQECGTDLEAALSSEQWDKYADQIYWFDTTQITEDDFGEDAAEVKQQEISEETRYKAYAINISEFYKVKEAKMFPYTDGEAYALIPANTKHLESALAFIEYLDQP